MHAVHVLHLFSISSFIPDHQNLLRSASVFDEPECLKWIASTTALFNSSATTILSPANSKPNQSFGGLAKTRRESLGALSFCLLRTQIFSCNSLGATKVLCIKVFGSNMNLNSAFFKCSTASVLFVLGLLIM